MKHLKLLTGGALIIFGALLISTYGCKKESGCGDPEAVNYDPSVKKDDGSCVYGGCTDTAATNYNSKAKYDDGTCKYAAPPTPQVLASDWISNADWDNAETIIFTFTESPYGFTISNRTLTAGQPYIMQIINPAANTAKHYFATDAGPDFFTAIATRKVQTYDAEYKAPYFEAIELLEKTSQTMVELYFVAVKTGRYHIICTIGGHQAAGMDDYIDIVGEAYELDLEIDEAFNTELARDGRKSGSHAVWNPYITTSMTFNESPYGFNPDPLTLKVDSGYKVQLINPAANQSKHYYTASDFYKKVVIRKCQDSQGEIKPFYLKAVELRTQSGGTQTDLYLVPTITGTFPVECTIEGHVALGMDGFIIVQ